MDFLYEIVQLDFTIGLLHSYKENIFFLQINLFGCIDLTANIFYNLFR